MNKILKLSTLFLLVSLFTVYSCSKEEIDNDVFDFQSFAIKIQSDQNYQNYKSAQEELFTLISNQEINLVDILSRLKFHEVDDLCTVDIYLMEGVNGAGSFFNNYCTMRSNLNSILSSFDEIDRLTTKQYRDLFACDINFSINQTGNSATSRAACVSEFNQTFNESSELCHIYDNEYIYNSCIDSAIHTALEVYDDCCDGGGSGCP